MKKEIMEKLLLHCVGIRCRALTTAEIEQLSEDDWNEVIKQANLHRITSMLCNYIKTLDPDMAIPDAVRNELQEIYLCNSLDNVQRFHNLSNVLELLQDNGISVIILKGGILAGNVYQSLALRPMNDIDLLVKSEDMSGLDEIFTHLGYTKLSTPFSEERTHLMKHRTYIKRTKDAEMTFKFDFHIRLFEIPKLNPWENAAQVKVGTAEAFTLDTEDLLLHLCIHLDKHIKNQEIRLIWWHDIAEILHSYAKDIDWDYIIKMIQIHNVEKSFCRILHATAEWFDIDIPANIIKQPEAEALLLNDMVFPTYTIDQQKSREVLKPLVAISRTPVIRDKIYIVFRGLFPPRDFLAKRYSVSRPGLIYFYYPFRMVQCGLKAIKILHRLPAYLKNK